MDEYLVSARKYRPLSFDSVVGQLALTSTLKNAVKTGKLAHAYLFCGPRGVGKTTCARIFAKAINCLSPTAEGEACNQCESCRAFNEQRSFNIFELDAASNNSVEQIKSLMEQTRIPPQVGKYKVFIIDEVHMLSAAAFNAFLKTLEEPPAHVIFILATTEKHKILPTILSRCQIYDFERMTVANIISHLKHVAEREGYKYEQEALEVIAEKADGGMRDALSIFDQVASFCQGDISYKKVIEDLNVLDTDNYFNIVDASIDNKVSEVMVLINNIISHGFDGGQMILGLAKHIRNVMMAKDEITLKLIETSEQMKQRYAEQAKKCDNKFLYQALKLLNQCDINYKTSSNKRLLVELTLIQVAQITQPDDSASAGRRPRRLKSLFNRLSGTDRQPRAAIQVAAAKFDANSKNMTDGNGNANANSPQVIENQENKNVYNPSRRPTLKLNGVPLGNSWENIRQRAAKKKLQIIPGSLPDNDPNLKTIDEQQEFTNEELEYQWLSMCNRMPEKYVGVASRMKNMCPKITVFPNVEVIADNQLILEQMEAIKVNILKTLRIYLRNNAIQLSFKLTNKKDEVKILSRKEQFEQMAEKNKLVDTLRELFGLELA